MSSQRGQADPEGKGHSRRIQSWGTGYSGYSGYRLALEGMGSVDMELIIGSKFTVAYQGINVAPSLTHVLLSLMKHH